MDQNLFYIGGALVPFVCMLAMFFIRKDIGMFIAFIGFLVGLFIFLGANSDGSITVTYPQFSGDTSHTIPFWPAAYIPLLFMIMDIGALAYRGLST